MDAPARLRAFIARHALFTPESKILAAVSGGKDSVMMCRLLHTLGYPIAIAHCNFKLRGDDANGDEDFVRSLAAEMGAAFYCRAFNTGQYAAENGLSIQMAARDLRHKWFKQLLDEQGYSCVAIAHTATDNTETVWLNMLRGTGLRGAAGMPAKNGRLVRPLLCFTEDEVLAWLAVNGVAWRKDASNDAVYYKRNYVRRRLLPEMRKLNPQAEAVMRRNSEKMQLQDQLLQQYQNNIRSEAVAKEGADTAFRKDVLARHNYNAALLEDLLRPYGFTFKLCTEIAEALQGNAVTGTAFCNDAYKLLVERDYLIIMQRGHKTAVLHNIIEYGCTELTLANGDTLKITYTNCGDPGLGKTDFSDSMACYADGDRLQWPLLLRHAQKGDRIQPYGMAGTRLLSDLFNDYKVRSAKKLLMPVLVNANGDIIWVPGIRTAEGVKVTAGTGKMVIFKYIISRV